MYNLRYGTGGRPLPFPWSGYFRRTSDNLKQTTAFLKALDPDILGLIEVDAGSYRTGRRNQAEIIAGALGHYHTYKSKYGDSRFTRRIPIVNKQGNAFLTRDTIANAQFHYFEKGLKRLVIELEMEHLTIFLVHLALSFRIRHQQLSDLYSLVKRTEAPHIVAGDFNSLWGDREINLFLAATGLCSAAPRAMPSYPSWSPKRQLDFILHCPRIKPTRFVMPRVTFSDHLPLVCDFEVDA